MIFPDLVFVDTSVFIAENFFTPGNRINTLRQLAIDKKITLVLSEITIKEVRKHVKSSVRESWRNFDKSCKALRNRPELDAWRKSTNEKIEEQLALGLFDEFLSSTGAKILDYSYCSDVEQVFTEYFEQQKPFAEGRKKDEFPDAFVLVSLERFATEKNEIIIVLSEDLDIKGYVSKKLKQVDYRQYISSKVAEGLALEELGRLLEDEKLSLEQKIQKEVDDYLDDFRLYLTCLNLTDVSFHTVKNVEVEINPKEYDVILVTERYIEVEIQPVVSFHVDVDYVNYEYAVYDREDGAWYGTEDDTYEVDGSTVVNATLRYYYGEKILGAYLDMTDLELSAIMDAIE